MPRGKCRKFTWGPGAPWGCEFRCGRHLQAKDATARDWIWFTGYGNRTVHFCPWCAIAGRHEVELILEQLDLRPDGFPGGERDCRLNTDAIVGKVLGLAPIVRAA